MVTIKSIKFYKENNKNYYEIELISLSHGEIKIKNDTLITDLTHENIDRVIDDSFNCIKKIGDQLISEILK